nr:hypothetical protein CFP56_49151 [Quercus suber]
MVTITLYRSEYLSISLMALFTLFNFHFGLSLRGQIECSMSVVMGLMDSPSHFVPFSRFLTSSLLQSQFSTWLSQTLIVSLLYLPTPLFASNAYPPPPLSTPLSIATADTRRREEK